MRHLLVDGNARSLRQRFWAKVDRGEGCWLWRGATNGRGYGQLWISDDRPMLYAHRVSWEIHYRPVPDGLEVMHRCDNPLCVRPDHLCLGTHAENMADAAAKRRTASGERHGRSKLSAEDVASIREARRAGVSPRALAEAFGVGRHHVYAVCSRRFWP